MYLIKRENVERRGRIKDARGRAARTLLLIKPAKAPIIESPIIEKIVLACI